MRISDYPWAILTIVCGICMLAAYYRYHQTSGDGAYGQGLFHYGQFMAYAAITMVLALVWLAQMLQGLVQ